MMRKIGWLIFVFLFLALAGEAFANSPFQRSAQAAPAEKESSFKPADLLPSWVRDAGSKAMGRILVWQVQLRQKAGGYARQIRENPWGKAFWSYMGLAFAYGVVHALGPGHGKVFVSTWFLSRKGSLAQAITMGGLMGFLHVFSALVLVFILYFVLKAGGPGAMDGAGSQIQKFSAGLIVLVGIFMVWKSFRSMVHGHGEGDNCSCCAPASDSRSFLSLSLAVGMVPCPGAALILFFSISLDILLAGVLAMVFLAAGLSLTTITFGVLSLYVRRAFATMGSGVRVRPLWYQVPVLVGALCITGMGALLFFSPV
ncbi:nickel/cobalt transporter [Desulfobotulus mexicanus]|uniref:Nickel/cobalt efflux system n=1 Tax=Desulfobotulus mexicanus TaxID=2586642 RepID=A0A5Q4VE75_9BACT|nr:high-affinity nickel-transporter [Desulfobotulus mexicanus]TYT75994.1 high-affinity nickel-transporter [Desulfobotulus mexicanus]